MLLFLKWYVTQFFKITNCGAKWPRLKGIHRKYFMSSRNSMPVCWSLHGSALYWHPATWHFPLSLDDLTIAAPDIQDIADPANNNGFRYRKFIVGKCFDHWSILVKTFTSDKINMFSFTCIFRIKISLFLPWIYFPFGAFVFLS